MASAHHTTEVDDDQAARPDLLFGDAGSNDQCFGNVGYDREVLWLAGPQSGETINSIAGVINLP